MESIALLAAICFAGQAGEARPSIQAVATILEARCVRCHGGTATKGSLDLTTAEDSRKAATAGRRSSRESRRKACSSSWSVGKSPRCPRAESRLRRPRFGHSKPGSPPERTGRRAWS